MLYPTVTMGRLLPIFIASSSVGPEGVRDIMRLPPPIYLKINIVLRIRTRNYAVRIFEVFARLINFRMLYGRCIPNSTKAAVSSELKR